MYYNYENILLRTTLSISKKTLTKYCSQIGENLKLKYIRIGVL